MAYLFGVESDNPRREVVLEIRIEKLREDTDREAGEEEEEDGGVSL